ncbi:putative transcription factor interactor and regulator CCHC(Zn) family [Helianthus annuus]|nr:putative transcription factor interactor and regulator CCHC(Zn) family [Helianthus annuus]
MSLHHNDAQISEQTTKFAQRIGEVILKTVELGFAMSRLNNEATQGPPKEAEVKPAPPAKKPIKESKTIDEQTRSHKRSTKRKASQNFTVVAHNGQAIPNQPAQPPVRKPYNGTAPFCNQRNLYHHVSVKCRKCQTCGLIGYTARVCPAAAAPNQAGNNPAQGRFLPGSCFNCGKMGHFRRNCPKFAKANLTHG